MEKTVKKKKMHGGKIALYVIAVFWTVVTLFPVVVTVLASFKTNSEIYLNLFSFPEKLMLQNYVSANKTADALRTICNSLVPEIYIYILYDRGNGTCSLYAYTDQQYRNSIKRKKQSVLFDSDLCCVRYVPGNFPLYRIFGWYFKKLR